MQKDVNRTIKYSFHPFSVIPGLRAIPSIFSWTYLLVITDKLRQEVVVVMVTMFSIYQGCCSRDNDSEPNTPRNESRSDNTDTDVSENERSRKRKKRKWSQSSSEERTSSSVPKIKRNRLIRTPEMSSDKQVPKSEPRKVKLGSGSDSAKRKEDRAKRFAGMLEPRPKKPSRFSSSSYQCPAARPVDRDKPGWFETHQNYTRIVQRTHSKIVLVGDSMVKGLARYQRVWRNHFASLGALNFGIGGDRTQHVLWRLQNGELEFNPDIVVIHVGTNNVNQDPADDIVQGLLAIVDYITNKTPSTKIIVTGLLPRDEFPSFRRKKIDEVNANLEEIIDFTDGAKYGHVHFLKPESDWVLEGGMIDDSLYHTDFLHLIEAGDEKFAKAIVGLIKEVKEGGIKKPKSDVSPPT